jgi:hypothetical protein
MGSGAGSPRFWRPDRRNVPEHSTSFQTHRAEARHDPEPLGADPAAVSFYEQHMGYARQAVYLRKPLA